MKTNVFRSIQLAAAKRLLGAAVLLAAPLGRVEIASAQSTVWVADGVGNWNVPGNWSNGVPGQSDVAAINNGGTARLFDLNGFITGLSLAQTSGNAGTLDVPGGRLFLVNTGVLFVGERGQGSLNVTNGGTISNHSSTIGVFAGSSGVATVNGAGSTWNATNQVAGALLIGDRGAGTLNITGGGVVTSFNGRLGLASGSTGMVTVNGSGSAWNVTSSQADALIVGNSGAGTLNITGGGVVTSMDATIGVGIGSTGTVLIDGPGSRWNSASTDVSGGTGTATLTVQNGGALVGTALVAGGGTVRGDGTIGSLDNQGGDVAPGSSIGTLNIGGNYKQEFSSAKLQIELASNTSFDKLAVAGELRLTSGIFGVGALEVSLVGGYVPSGTRSFDVLDWGTQFGTFDTITLPTLGGTLVWNTSQLYTTGVISVTGPAATLTADFDSNGVVNGADLTRWRTGYGTGTTRAQGNADLDGDVDGGDFLTWQRQLGSPPSAPANAAVPEPASVCLAAVALVALTTSPGRRHSRQEVEGRLARRYPIPPLAPLG